MFIEIQTASCAEIIFTSFSLLVVLGHNLWLVARKDAAKFRIVANTSDVFPESDSAVKPERVKDFRIVTKRGSAPVENYRVEENSLVAEAEATENFYAAIELHPHPITLEVEKFIGYIKHEDAPEAIMQKFSGNAPIPPQRESYAKFAKVFCRVNESNENFNLPVGHRFEIVPQSDLRVGKMVVQVLFEGKPLENLRVSCGGEGINGGQYLAHARTDADGLAEIEIERAGHWFVRTHYIRQLADRTDFDWESFWSAVTFDVK